MIASSSWEIFLQEARAYHTAACNGRKKRPQVFVNSIVYNMLGIAVEKYLMAFLMQHADMADNHTFTDLADSANRVRPVPPELSAKLRRLDNVQNLCPVYDQELPEDYTDEVVNTLQEAADEVCAYAGFTR